MAQIAKKNCAVQERNFLGGGTICSLQCVLLLAAGAYNGSHAALTCLNIKTAINDLFIVFLYALLVFQPISKSSHSCLPTTMNDGMMKYNPYNA